MAFADDATAILIETHDRLRDLLAAAVEAQAYQEVASIACLAEHVSKLLNGSGTPTSVIAQNTEPVAKTAATGGRPRSRHRTLPRFERDGDRLVKAAWSKKDRAEYEHRAPRNVVFFLLDAIRRNKGEGAIFQTQDILPLIDGGREVPSYQAYLALAWLREEGIITKKGRNGYILKPNIGTTERIDELWKALPSPRR